MSSQPIAVSTAQASDVTVIIPVHRAGDVLRQCLAALNGATPPPGEIVVVVDGEGDGSWRAITTAAGVRTIELPHQIGAAAARNVGVKESSGSILFFVDADVVVAPDAIAQVVSALNDNPRWCAVFGSYDDAPGAPNLVAQYKGLLNHYVHQHARDEASTFWTALGAIRRDTFLAVGGLAPNCRLEDIELGYRLRAAGYRIGVRKTLYGKHLKAWTAGSLIRSDFFDRALPWTALMLRSKSAEKDLNLDTANRLSVACVGLLVLAPLLALWRPWAMGVVALLLIVVLMMLNVRLYLMFLRKRGPSFTIAAIAWHWLYFFYGGLGFLVGVVLHILRKDPTTVALPMPTVAGAAR